MKKVSISTVYKGFNYGSSLQAYASKMYLSSLGYQAEIIGYKDGILKGRDVRLGKILVIFLRTFWRPTLFKKTFLTYKVSLKKQVSEESKNKFLCFTEKKLRVKKMAWKELKTYANNDNVIACICGSDQIWNATNIYVDPLYYLKFAPIEKRIAYAPSFGKREIPKYNKRVIKRNISKINYLSVREDQGVNIVKELINKDVEALIDPTLLINKFEWMKVIDNSYKNINKEYILLYFLDKPSIVAIRFVKKISQTYNYCFICIPYKHDEFNDLDNCDQVDAGPLDFVELVAKAKFVCTDSFHGAAFSINSNVQFLIFHRNYGVATEQSSRIKSLLKKLNLQERFVEQSDDLDKVSIRKKMSFEDSNKLLDIERKKSRMYLMDSLYKIKEMNNGEKNEE